MQPSTSQKGDAAVLLLASKLAERGLVVLQPICESLPFDLALFFEGAFYRLQVKRASKAHKSEGRFVIPVRKVNVRRGSGRKPVYQYTKEHTDFVVGVVIETGDCYFFPIESLGGVSSYVQVDPAGLTSTGRRRGKINSEQFRNVICLGGRRVKI